MNRRNVLLISDDGEFTRAVMNRWQTERTVPAFTVLGTTVLKSPSKAQCDLAIAGPDELSGAVLEFLAALSQPAIMLARDSANAQRCRLQAPRVLVLGRQEGWVEPLVLLGTECLKRVDLSERLEDAERKTAEASANATLGHYMLDMRHSLNNALTSVLGNAELLVMETDAFTPEVRDQLQTIHSMTLRIHQILARFSSLEIELGLAKREGQHVGGDMLRKVSGWTSF